MAANSKIAESFHVSQLFPGKNIFIDNHSLKSHLRSTYSKGISFVNKTIYFFNNPMSGQRVPVSEIK
jgi:hypothetical protein